LRKGSQVDGKFLDAMHADLGADFKFDLIVVGRGRSGVKLQTS